MRRAVAWCLSLVGSLWLLSSVSLSVGDPDPLVAAFAVVRQAGLLLGWYLVAVTVAGLAARATRVPSLVRGVDLITIPPVRRMLHASLGAGMAVTSLVAPAAADEPHPGRPAIRRVDDARPPAATGPRPATGDSLSTPPPSAARPQATASSPAATERRESPPPTRHPLWTPPPSTAPPPAADRPPPSPDQSPAPRIRRVDPSPPPPSARPAAPSRQSPDESRSSAPPTASSPSPGPDAPPPVSPPAPRGAHRADASGPPAAPPPADAPQAAAAPPSSWTVAPGESFWAIAESVLSAALARPPADAETARYWTRLIDANRPQLKDPANPDLLFTGQVLTLPPP